MACSAPLTGAGGRPRPLGLTSVVKSSGVRRSSKRPLPSLNGLLRDGFEEAIDVGQVIEDGRRYPNIAFGNAGVHLSFGQTLADFVRTANDEANDRRSRFRGR